MPPSALIQLLLVLDVGDCAWQYPFIMHPFLLFDLLSWMYPLVLPPLVLGQVLVVLDVELLCGCRA